MGAILVLIVIGAIVANLVAVQNNEQVTGVVDGINRVWQRGLNMMLGGNT